MTKCTVLTPQLCHPISCLQDQVPGLPVLCCTPCPCNPLLVSPHTDNTAPTTPRRGCRLQCRASRHRTISVISVFKSANYPIKRRRCPVQRRGAHATLASVASTADSETGQQVLGPGSRHKYTSIQLSAAASGHAGEGSQYQANHHYRSDFVFSYRYRRKLYEL